MTALPLLPLLLAAAQPSQDPGGEFRAACERYLAGDFEGAALRYQALAARGFGGAALHYDLGNAWFRAGRPGRAAAAWERALAEDPGDAEARANLETARRGFALRLPWARSEPLGERTAARLSSTAAALAFAVPWALLWLALGLRFVVRGGRRSALSLAAAALATLALGGGLVVAVKARALREPRAVVVAPGASLLEAPSPSLAPQLDLPEGAAVRVVGSEGDWLRVRLPGGVEGWARREDLEVL